MLINKGNPLVMGSEKIGRSYNFSVACNEKSAALLLFDNKGDLKHRIDMDEHFKSGNVFSCRISDISLERALYCYEIDGKRMTDPYAKTITDCCEFGIEKENPCYLSRVALESFDWEGDQPLNLPYSDCIFYKLHVRGFTKSRTSGVKHKGTFAGIIEKIPYLKRLGITTLELMPAYEFDEMMRFPQLYRQEQNNIYHALPIHTPVSYWGYVKGFHFAPKASFTAMAQMRSDYTVEFKKMVKQLHANGIEVVMEMYFDGERPDYILDCIRYWVTQYHIDGVHLYGPVAALETAAADPVLAKTKIITVFWNGNADGCRHMANYNDGFAGTMRRFLKGDENQLADFVNVSRYNPPQSANINYITNHNGFTMLDLVSYDRKHNEANGENNQDGEDFNYSWNCGVEGKSRKQKIVQLRQRQIKNAFMMLLLAQGTPLLLAGDEFENSQGGNNNPYCIDGETTWLNWKKADTACQIEDFVRTLIKLRRQYPILHMERQLLASDTLSCGFPDISYHGSSAWYQSMENYNRHIGILYCSKYTKAYAEDKAGGQTAGEPADSCGTGYDLIYVGCNMHWEQHELALPKLPEKAEWEKLLCSGSMETDVCLTDNRAVLLAPRTMAVLRCHISEKGNAAERSSKKRKNRTKQQRRNEESHGY